MLVFEPHAVTGVEIGVAERLVGQLVPPQYELALPFLSISPR